MGSSPPQLPTDSWSAPRGPATTSGGLRGQTLSFGAFLDQYFLRLTFQPPFFDTFQGARSALSLLCSSFSGIHCSPEDATRLYTTPCTPRYKERKLEYCGCHCGHHLWRALGVWSPDALSVSGASSACSPYAALPTAPMSLGSLYVSSRALGRSS